MCWEGKSHIATYGNSSVPCLNCNNFSMIMFACTNPNYRYTMQTILYGFEIDQPGWNRLEFPLELLQVDSASLVANNSITSTAKSQTENSAILTYNKSDVPGLIKCNLISLLHRWAWRVYCKWLSKWLWNIVKYTRTFLYNIHILPVWSQGS